MTKRITILLIALVTVGIAFAILVVVAQINPSSTELGMGPIYTLTLTVTGTPPTPTSSRTITKTPTITQTSTVSPTATITKTPTVTSTISFRTTETRTSMPSSTAPVVGHEIQLLSPLNGRRLSGDSNIFKWMPIPKAQKYRIEIQKMPAGNIVRRNSINVPYVFIWWLPSGGEYRWRVTALNRIGEVICISEWRTFTYKNPESTQTSP